MTIEERIEAIVAAVFAAFMEGSDAIPVREIAERVGCTPPQVNSACDKMFYIEGGWQRISPTDVYVDVREKNYNSVTHKRRCRGYKVTYAYIRTVIKGGNITHK